MSTDVTIWTTQSRDATIVDADIVLWERGRTERVHVTGTARRDPRDKHNPYIGELLATSRALDALARKLGRRANGLVKHADDVKAMEHTPPPAEVLVEVVPTARMTFRRRKPGGVAHALWRDRTLCGVPYPPEKLTGTAALCMNCRTTNVFEDWVLHTPKETRDQAWKDSFE